jgi:hypothetical protein
LPDQSASPLTLPVHAHRSPRHVSCVMSSVTNARYASLQVRVYILVFSFNSTPSPTLTPTQRRYGSTGYCEDQARDAHHQQERPSREIQEDCVGMEEDRRDHCPHEASVSTHAMVTVIPLTYTVRLRYSESHESHGTRSTRTSLVAMKLPSYTIPMSTYCSRRRHTTHGTRQRHYEKSYSI